MELLIDNLAGIVQYNGRFPLSIDDVCEIMNSDDTPLDNFANLNAASLDMNQEVSSYKSLTPHNGNIQCLISCIIYIITFSSF